MKRVRLLHTKQFLEAYAFQRTEKRIIVKILKKVVYVIRLTGQGRREET